MPARFSGVLLDLGGVVFVGDDPISGAVEGVARLQRAGLGVRFLTNTTRGPRRTLVEKLRRLGVEATASDIFTPAVAARHVLGGRATHFLVHPDLMEDFADRTDRAVDAVLVGDAGPGFTYNALNSAFRAVERGADLFALAKNRTFADEDGALSLDAGPFVAALEYASGRPAHVIGKPSDAFFRAALEHLALDATAVAMIGDDVEADVGGAMTVGMAGILVRTGKYKNGDEGKIHPAPTHVSTDLMAAVDWILRSGE